MFSWEVNQARRDATLIGILVPPGGVSIDWAVAFTNLRRPAICEVSRISGYPFGEARTYIANEMLKAGYSWLFFLDSDVIPVPETIIQLMSHRLPIVSALYYQRFPHAVSDIEVDYRPVMLRAITNAEGKISTTPIIDFKPGSLVEADFMGAGCLLIHRSVFERMLRAGIKRFFEWTLHADNPNGGFLPKGPRFRFQSDN